MNPINDFVDIRNEQQASLSISGSGAQSAAISNTGIYDVTSDVDCYLKVGPTASDVTTSTGYLLYAGNTIPLKVDSGQKIGAITSGASGTLKWHKVAS